MHTLTEDQKSALRPVMAAVLITWAAELISFAALGIYWWRAANPNLQLIGFWILSTIILVNIVRTVYIRKIRLIRGEQHTMRYWIGVLRVALIGVLFFLLYFFS